MPHLTINNDVQFTMDFKKRVRSERKKKEDDFFFWKF